jgi:general secretion pathway protein K
MYMTMKGNRGIALLVTLLMISLIVVLTLQFNTSMRSELYAAYNLKNGIMLESVAKSGFNCAFAVLKEDGTDSDTLLDTWESFGDYSAYSATLFDEGIFDVKIVDLERRIQINNLIDDQGALNEEQRSLLSRFLNLDIFALETDQVDDIIDAVIDWIDPNEDITSFGGAENDYYQSLENPYSCRNGPMESIEELLLVKGITRELYYGTEENPGIRKYLTIYGDGKININTAEPVVLKSLSDQITDDMVVDMDAYRRDEKNEDTLSDPKWIQNIGMGSISINLITTRSTHFEITSKGKKDRMEKTIHAVVKREENGDFQVLSWRKS